VRAQISLIDQQFAQVMSVQNLPNLATVFQNELNAIRADVYRLQIAYLNTILLSPIPGTVTGIYKNPGDAVKAGEPVIRVENNAVVLLVGTVVYRGPISVGTAATVQSTLFDVTPLAPPLSGTVVLARGRQLPDHWEVIIQCNNLDGSGKPILPLGYYFDHKNTTITI
jgi:hypothetical protein